MLVEFSVSNFMSFQQENTLSMLATSDGSLADGWVAKSAGKTLLRGAMIFGANASGKSNLLKAVQFSQQMVLNSAQGSQSGEALDFKPFRLERRNLDKPSHFQYIFVMEETVYRYGFEINRDAVVTEWLYASFSSRESMLFEREGSEIHVGSRFSGGRAAVPHTRVNALFLSVAAMLNHETAKRILGWFRRLNVINGLQSNLPHVLASALLDVNVSDKVKRLAFQLIKNADVGIDGVHVRQTSIMDSMIRQFARARMPMPDNFDQEVPEEIKTQMVNELEIIHRTTLDGQPDGETVSFDLNDESDGTQKLVSMVGPLMDTLLHDKILLVDEFSASLHDMLCISLVVLFRDLGGSRNRRSQLVLTTHNTRLLTQELIRRDQIWLIEKQKSGASSLYALSDFKNIRKDTSLEKNYLAGIFGAVPKLAYDDLAEVIHE